MSVSELGVCACRLTARGHVQGVGLRPAVVRLARELGLTGYVRNATDGVEMHLEGDSRQIREFRRRMPESLPGGAQVSISSCEDCPPSGADRFEIIESLICGPLVTRVPPDRATCEACLVEVASASDRRTEYAFTSCTQCGPRYSLIEAMPYDRPRTSMRTFPLCEACLAEYESPEDRRFHAQTNACAECGPRLWIAPQPSQGGPALEEAANAVRAGRILALRGLGGYQLIVDATNEPAVARLRQRKRRLIKPLAVMVQSLTDADRLCRLTPRARELLASSERPIVLAPERSPSPLAAGVHPGLSELGLFLPTTALHWLLLDRLARPLVVTSGNPEGDPLAAEAATAEGDLQGVADVWLHHDREIVRPIDDSVVRIMGQRGITLRSARGLAPLPLPALEDAFSDLRTNPQRPAVLAVGGHQKSAIAIFNGEQAVLGPHVGDLESLATRERFVEHVEQMRSLYRCEPTLIVHDLHPDYFTTRWAQSSGVRTLAVQHHHAHVVAGMLENDWLRQRVLGVALDGTGYGPDGTIWGGEFLLSTATEYRRAAHLLPFRLPGGESAIHHPWRVAAALLAEAIGQRSVQRLLEELGLAEKDVDTTLRMVTNSRLSPVTTSAGRLFDGVATLVLGVIEAGYEGHPAMLLEAAVDELATGAYDFGLLESEPVQLDWRPMLQELLADRRRGASPGVMAARFHRGLARGIGSICRRFDRPVVLSGGVFQNRVLTLMVVEELHSAGLLVGVHEQIPPNDGGLAAGQLAVALTRLQSTPSTSDHGSFGAQ